MLLDQLQQDLKHAMLAKEESKVSTLRMLISAVRYTGNGTAQEFSDEDVISVIQKEVKKRREAAEGFRKGGREEAALKEEAELEILAGYLPEQLSDEELTKIVEEAITKTGAKSPADMGRVIGMVMGSVGSGADGSRVSGMVKEKLLQA
jgi:uncharacterized protein